MEAPKKKQRVDKQGRATANFVQRTLETWHQAREQDICLDSWPSSLFHDALRPFDKAGWFAAAYFVLSLLQAQLQALWHWLEESPLPVGGVATTDCVTFLMKLKQRNPSLQKIPPALIAALARVHPHGQSVSTWGKSATEVLRTQLKSALRSIKQSVGASASASATAAVPMPPTDPKTVIAARAYFWRTSVKSSRMEAGPASSILVGVAGKASGTFLFLEFRVGKVLDPTPRVRSIFMTYRCFAQILNCI